jgi:hypothetical protein
MELHPATGLTASSVRFAADAEAHARDADLPRVDAGEVSRLEAVTVAT